MQTHDMNYAGFWIRFAATIIDTLLVMLVTFPLLWWIYGSRYFDGSMSGLFAGPADILISWVLPSLAVILFWRHRQATPGKMLLSLKVVDADSGAPLSLNQGIGRYFAYFASTLPLGLGFLWVAFDKRKQGWHDKLAHTVVIRARRDAEGGRAS
ncbi:MAG: RDD family protein [Rhodocyclales bacterium]|nr:RDD family protein [Rhodocyclales bacterium]